MRFYLVLRAIFAPFLKLLYRIKVEGKENEPKTNYIVCANHSSAVDALLLVCILKQPIHFVAKSELVKNRFVDILFKKLGIIYVNRDGRDISALKKMISLSRGGESLGIFPQGTRMPFAAPKPEQAIPGFAAVAMTAKIPVLPISIVTDKIKPAVFKKTRIIIHDPISYDEYMHFKDSPTREEVCMYCFGKVCEPFEDIK